MTSDEHRRSAPTDKIAEYRGCAVEAKLRADFETDDQIRKLYLSVAAAWAELADELERVQAENTIVPLPVSEPTQGDGNADEIRRLKSRAHHARQLSVHVPDPATAERLKDYAARLDDEAAELERRSTPGKAQSG
jgi:hypothetical protein